MWSFADLMDAEEVLAPRYGNVLVVVGGGRRCGP